MIYVCITLSPATDTEWVWNALTEKGCSLLYSLEDPQGFSEIHGYIPHQDHIGKLLEQFPEIIKITPASLGETDWESQWSTHSPNFSNGLVHIDMRKYSPVCCKTLIMQPGPGFGDLSHPTTNLVLEMMADQVQGKYVIDIGSGSGILSLAASYLGAQHVHGIDIDPQAVHHASENAELNELGNRISFGLPEDNFAIPADIPVVILMNMISSEQIMAWESLPKLNNLHAICITSGILSVHKEEYLALTRTWNWELIVAHERDGWMGFKCKSGLGPPLRHPRLCV